MLQVSRRVPIFMGESCSRQCLFCSNLTPCRYVKIKTDESYKTVIAQILMQDISNADEIFMFGGDPLYKPFFGTVCEYLIRNNYTTVGIMTNGDLLAEKKNIIKSIRYPRIYLEVTNLEGQAGIQAHTQHFKTLSKTINIICDLFTSKEEIGESCIPRIYLYNHVYPDITTMLSMFLEIGVKRLEICLPRFTSQFLLSDMGLIKTNLLPLSEVSQVLKNDLLREFSIEFINFPSCMLESLSTEYFVGVDEYVSLITVGDPVLHVEDVVKDKLFFRELACSKCDRANCKGIPKEYLLIRGNESYEYLKGSNK